jgi:hypothetical protein
MLNKLFQRWQQPDPIPALVRHARPHAAAATIDPQNDWQYADNAIPVPEVCEGNAESDWDLWEQASSRFDELQH